MVDLKMQTLVMLGDDDQIVPTADPALLSTKLLQNGVLEVYETFPHGMCTTHADVINPDLLAFIQGEPRARGTRPKETTMTKRLNFLARKNAGIEGLVAVETWLAENFDPKLLELVRVRASQMNGCAHCLHMHRQDALKLGETEDRLLLLDAWRESGLYTERERATLAWA